MNGLHSLGKKTTECAVTLICGALRDLVAFKQFKKREKHP